MRVVHLDAGRAWRGGQTQLRLLVRGWPDATVIVPDDAPIRAALEADGIEVVPVPVRGRWWGRPAVWRALERLGPDLVAAHDGHGAAVALGGRWPVVVHRRVDFAPSRVGARRLCRAAGVIAVSGAVAAVVRRAGVERIRTVYDAVDPAPIDAAVADRDGVRAELGLARERRLVVAVGALVDHKGHRHLIDALAAVPDAVLVVLGDGPLRGALRARADGRGVDARWLGVRADVPRWLKAADLFVHPSVEEGLGQAVIEAGLAGARIVATRAGGIPELGLGTLVNPGDPAALADAIRAALAQGPGIDDPRAIEALRERFSVGRLVAATRDAYAAFAPR
ncbi:MAG: glycosyltransferase [Myxococcota bacterium]